ncbi:MAG: hypothetical protein PHX20_00805, partial [Candidatus Omnitrophica bacterium]|nr:hypothetical protein [Candidatus Omnitrophota bacterium]
MKKIILTGIFLFLLSGTLFAQADIAAQPDPDKVFYLANGLYEKRDYEKALEEYNKILNSGMDSGSLYYNMANTYFKLGKLGYAVLFYEKAKRIMPQDSDLKTNLNYARSLVASSAVDIPRRNPIVTFVKAPFKDLSINAIALSALIIYLALIALMVVGIMNPVFYKKVRLACIVIGVIF